MTTRLVIVESPAKARTIAGYLGDDYVVESSVGHVRDLPQKAADVPPAFKGEPWARLGVDVDNDFKPLYVVSPGKKDVVRDLKRALKDADELYLATDEDREGEAIAWHLLELLSPRVPVHRMVFHEITPQAIQRAIDEPRDLDRRLVDAQEARRILDRLYGYEVSPVLWKKIRTGLSAGRVQSVATRLVVQRERERMAFRAAGYWDIEGTFSPEGALDTFDATLVSVDGTRLASGKDFDDATGAVKNADVLVLDEAGASGLAADLAGASFAVRSVESKPYTSKPKAPFMTSTLQQEAGRKLRFSSSRTMAIAQRLYENGHITYMRTDSTTLSDAALTAARTQILEKYGKDYLPDAPRLYTRKVKNAQEAHEAIRPAGDSFRTPDQLRSQLDNDSHRLYELIWARTVASQMTDARGETMQVRLGATSSAGKDAEFAASGRTILFPGWLKAYREGSDEPEGDRDDQDKILPPMQPGGRLTAERLEPKGHETKPPARYTEASLVQKLEELGVGRPSTYAATISTIIDREYVWKKGSALVPSFTAFAVVTLLETHFPDLVDYAFTARMEDDLDSIASGTAEAIPWLSRFYFGNGELGLKEMVSNRLGDIDARAVSSIPVGTDDEGRTIVARVGKYGPYLARRPAPGPGSADGAEEPVDEDTVSIPDDIVPDELTVERANELLDAPSGDREIGTDPESGLPVLARAGRFGPYVQLGELEDGGPKPKTASLFKDMSLDTIALDDALRLLSLPRVVGADPADGVEITVQNGRYGPYLKKANDSRSLATEAQLFTVTLDECLKILAEPKRGRGQQAAAPLRELGADPATDLPVVVKDGRFGPYVTDGESNASLRKGDTVEEITIDRASELLADRRARGPAKKKKGAKKKATAKKGTAKKKASAKKGTAKKTAAKKKAAATKSTP